MWLIPFCSKTREKRFTRPCLSSPNLRRSICKHLRAPPDESVSSSSSESESVLELCASRVSSSPAQIIICRSFGGNRAARRETSVVNEVPSCVRVKLKNGTMPRMVSSADFLMVTEASIQWKVGLRCDAGFDSRGDSGASGATMCFAECLRGPV